MDPVADALTALGGVATRAALLRLTSRAEVDEALRVGVVVAVARGRYALPRADDARQRAHALTGVLSLTSAALHHGWAVRTVPVEPHVTVPRNRNVAPARRVGVQLHYQDLLPEDVVDGIATSKVATLRDCLRLLPFPEALAVADSALRDGERSALALAVAGVHGPGRPQARRIAIEARGEAANAFESSLRAIALEVAGLRVEPQVLIRETDPWCRPDLVDRELRIVLEADSFAWHGDRRALARDARRYNLLVAAGWLVLRFAWEDVMFDPDYVASVLRAVVAERAHVGRRRRGAA
jgi:very-short-patch-repair endonuclease